MLIINRFERLTRIAEWLTKIEGGNAGADLAIHEATGQPGLVLLYTADEEVARRLLPPCFEWATIRHSNSMVYASCRRSGLVGGMPYPCHEQWSRTLPLALCGAALRAHARLAMG